VIFGVLSATHGRPLILVQGRPCCIFLNELNGLRNPLTWPGRRGSGEAVARRKD